MTLRILSISTLFPRPSRPAFGIFVGNQMRAVAARGDVDLTIVSPIGIPPWPLSLREPYRSLRQTPEKSGAVGIPVYYPQFTTIPKIGGTSNPARIAKAVLPIARKLHEQRPFDLIDAQFFFPDGPAAAIIAAELGLPLTIKARGADIHYWGRKSDARAQMLKAAEQAIGMLAVSHSLCEDMAGLGIAEDKTTVHYTGLDRERFFPMPRNAARALVSALPELGVWSKGPLLVCPGSLIARKGQRIVIEAMTELPDAVLALAGAGEEEGPLRTLAAQLGLEDRVQFLGLVYHDRLPQLFSAADVMVLPSVSEGLANVWVEALACGTPLVIPDVGGAREVMAEPSAGRIAERNRRAVAAAVRDILDDPPSQEDVAANAERFSWETNAAELVAYWQRLVGK